MGPYQYKARVLDCGLFSSIKTAERMIQEEIDRHVAEGWELLDVHPVQMAFAWRWSLLIFRKAAQGVQEQAES